MSILARTSLLWRVLVTVVAGGTKQTSRLRISNGCQAEVMWIAHMAAAGVGPDPQNVRIEPLASHDFIVPAGLAGTRYWPKLGCDAHGNRCSIGESGGPGESCGLEGCAPPVDTKFEASFGQNGEDWVDISLVDGFTLPFRMDMLLQEGKQCGAGDGDRGVTTTVDCSRLSLDDCPHDELMGNAASSVDLKVVHPSRKDVVGCYSPCSKFTFRQWGNALATNRTPWDPDVKDYCCPTPPESPEACRQGPVSRTRFVRTVHQGCPGVYGYAYDDGMGLVRCPDDTQYHVTFYCPVSGASSKIGAAAQTINVYDSAAIEPEGRLEAPHHQYVRLAVLVLAVLLVAEALRSQKVERDYQSVLRVEPMEAPAGLLTDIAGCSAPSAAGGSKSPQVALDAQCDV